MDMAKKNTWLDDLSGLDGAFENAVVQVRDVKVAAAQCCYEVNVRLHEQVGVLPLERLCKRTTPPTHTNMSKYNSICRTKC